MDNSTEMFSILRLTKQGSSNVDDLVVREFPLTIILNNQEMVTLLCSPTDLRYLAVGFLSSEGLLRSKDEIKKITHDERRGVVRVETGRDEGPAGAASKRIITSGCGRGTSFYSAADVVQGRVKRIESRVEISTLEVFALVNGFEHRSKIYKATGGVHSAALCDMRDILVFSEDIGRHNAMDKIFGECIMNDITTDDRIVVTSGRVTSEIVHKVARRNVPIIISRAAPTDLGLKLAADLGLTLLGFVRGQRMNVYTNDWRITRK